MRLIDAEAVERAINELESSPWASLGGNRATIVDALETVKYQCVRKMPTAFIVSIRCGMWKWVNPGESDSGHPYYYCSECGVRVETLKPENYCYCMNCGAKMEVTHETN